MGPVEGTVPSPYPRPGALFNKPDVPFDKRRARALPNNNNELLSKRRDLAALSLGGTALPM